MASDRHSAYGVTALVPVYNEVDAVGPAVRRIDAFLSEHVRTYEILLVESGSTDGTGLACDGLADDFEAVAVCHEGQRSGFGAALRLGFQQARHELVWVVPVDLPYALDALLAALPLLDRADAVVSYRTRDRRGPARRFQGWVYSTLVRTVLGLPTRSINAAFKVYRRDQVAELGLTSRGWFIDAEIIDQLHRRGRRLAEIPVEVLDREIGTSKVGAGDFVKVLAELRSYLGRRGVRRRA